MKYVGYDAIVPGQYDFIFGMDNLNKITNNANFEILGSNLNCDNCINNLKPYIIKEVQGIKVGILGIINSEIPELVPSSKLNDATFSFEVESIQKWVPEMKKNGSDIIIVLTSSGVPWDREEVYNDFINSDKNPSQSLNAIEMGYYAQGVDLIVSGGISKGYKTAWYDPYSHVYTIQNYGNGTSFGNMTGSRFGHGSANNATRAVIGGTNSSSGASKNNIEYITMGTSGSGSNFGNLTMDRGYTGAGAVGDRAIWAGNGGGTVGNAVTGIDYVTITSTGNASDFGDMTVVRDQVGADFPGNATRVAIAGGNTPGGYISTIDYVLVGTTGNASDFGNLTGAKAFCSAASGC